MNFRRWFSSFRRPIIKRSRIENAVRSGSVDIVDADKALNGPPESED